MVIGNGFFCDSREDALREMQQRAGCRVVRSNFPTVGNIAYYVSERGDIYGMQHIQDRYIIRSKKNERTQSGPRARLNDKGRECRLSVAVLVYCAFVLNRWQSDIKLEPKDGNLYNVSPDNLCPHQRPIPQEWGETMKRRQQIYKQQFLKVAWSVNYVTNLDIEDCKDAAQAAFIYLCTDGYLGRQRETENFMGLWIKVARMRGIDQLRHQYDRQVYDIIDNLSDRMPGGCDAGYEFDPFSILPGEKQRLYMRLYYEGSTPTEIAHMLGDVKPSSVASAVTRGTQYLKDYYYSERKYLL